MYNVEVDESKSAKIRVDNFSPARQKATLEALLSLPVLEKHARDYLSEKDRKFHGERYNLRYGRR